MMNDEHREAVKKEALPLSGTAMARGLCTKPDPKLEAARLRVFGTNRLHWSMPATTVTVLGAYLWCASLATLSVPPARAPEPASSSLSANTEWSDVKHRKCR